MFIFFTFPRVSPASAALASARSLPRGPSGRGLKNIITGLLCGLGALGAAQAMQFSVEQVCVGANCQPLIIANGPVERTSNERFKAISVGLPPGTVVSMKGNGGDLLGALRLGELIRQARFHTSVRESGDECLSACVFAFMGGLVRSVHPQARLGFHSLKSTGAGPKEEEAQRNTRRLLGVYLDQMGVDRRVLDYALTAPPGGLSLVDSAMAQRLGLSISANSTGRYTAWRLQASRSGQLLGYVTEAQINGAASITLGVTRVDGALRLLVHVKPLTLGGPTSDELSAQFGQDTPPPQIHINGKNIEAEPLKAWTRVNDGFQAWLGLNAAQAKLLESATSFAVVLGRESRGLIEPRIEFGSMGLSNALAAINRQASAQ